MLTLAQLALIGCLLPAITIPSTVVDPDASKAKGKSGDTSGASRAPK